MCKGEVLLLWTIVVVVMVEYQITVKVDVVGDLHEPDGTIKSGFGDTTRLVSIKVEIIVALLNDFVNRFCKLILVYFC